MMYWMSMLTVKWFKDLCFSYHEPRLRNQGSWDNVYAIGVQWLCYTRLGRYVCFMLTDTCHDIDNLSW